MHMPILFKGRWFWPLATTFLWQEATISYIIFELIGLFVGLPACGGVQFHAGCNSRVRILKNAPHMTCRADIHAFSLGQALEYCFVSEPQYDDHFGFAPML